MIILFHCSVTYQLGDQTRASVGLEQSPLKTDGWLLVIAAG
jgi:hypothetical protein